MGRTAILLVLALIAIPVLAISFDQPPSAGQWQLLKEVSLLMLVIALICFVVGELTGNFSQVDKLWSIVPIIYAWFMTIRAGLAGGFEPRMVLMASLVTLWGIRLTYNFSRQGGYSWKFWSGHEDYRWAHVRAKPGMSNPFLWKLFHLGFICLYQHALLLLITLPVLLAWQAPQPLGWMDGVLAVLFIALVLWETVADQQQWMFQNEKHRRMQNGQALGEVYGKGFIDRGLWGLCRHPNYFAEQSIWITFFLFSVLATGRLNWSVTGCVLLMLLFRGSSNLSESISAGKYSAYAHYQQRVPRFLPKFF